MSAPARKIAPLIDGQRLSRDEFLRRYEAMPHVKKAQLIGGIVYMPSPVRRSHGTHDSKVGVWLGHYAAYTPGCEVANNTTWLMLEDAPQPDSDLRILPEYGGRSGLDGAYASGAPELAVEVSETRADIDLGVKKQLYETAGVREYLVYILRKPELRWYRLRRKRYQLHSAPRDGIIRSRVFPGLWLDVPALLAGDMPRVLQVLDDGLHTPEHAKFVKQLARRKGLKDDTHLS
jgi:Uma2 family endonuclease